MGPGKPLRVALRIVLWSALTWFLLALLWAFLPSPSAEHDGNNGSDYPTAVLRAGKTLTRVYDAYELRVDSFNRHGFVLDYKLDIDTLSLSISDSKTELPIINNELRSDGEVSARQQVDVVARVGDPDGANLPWFQFADSVLLFWWIHKEYMNVSLVLDWVTEDMVDGGLQQMNLRINGRPSYEPLLTIEMRNNDTSTLTVIAPARPLSSSPSITYPIRIAIIHIIAPTAVFVNNVLSTPIMIFFNALAAAVYILFAIAVYGFLITLVFCLWRCLGGPPLEILVARMQGHLNRLNQNERLLFLRRYAIREPLDWLYRNRRVKAALDICRNRWHPERERERAAQVEETDMEKATAPKS